MWGTVFNAVISHPLIAAGGIPALICLLLLVTALCCVWILLRPTQERLERLFVLKLSLRTICMVLGLTCLGAGLTWLWLYTDNYIGAALWTPFLLTAVYFLFRACRAHVGPPDDKLVVAVAQFRPVPTGSAQGDAELVQTRLVRALRKKGEQAPLAVKKVQVMIHGADEEEEKALAQNIAELDQAHLILWGEVLNDEGDLTVTPRLKITRQLRGARMDERDMREFQTVEPEYIELEPARFKVKVASEIASAVILIHGLAYYHAGDWDTAVQILEHSGSREAAFYLGSSYEAKGDVSESPRDLYDPAIEAYHTVLGGNVTEYPDTHDDLGWAAVVGRADAFAKLAVVSGSEDSSDMLKRAIADYRNAAKARSCDRYPRDWARVQNNLGSALKQLAVRVEGQEALQQLRASEKAHRAALAFYARYPLPQQWATSQNNLGNTLKELSVLVEREKGLDLLTEAIEVYRANLDFFTKESFGVGFRIVRTEMG